MHNTGKADVMITGPNKECANFISINLQDFIVGLNLPIRRERCWMNEYMGKYWAEW